MLKKLSQYNVKLATLSEGKHSYDFVCDTEFFKAMENEEVTNANVNVHLDIEKKHEAYDLNFQCNGEIEIPCDRCMDPMKHPVDTYYHLKVKYGEEYNEDTDELLVLPWSETTLNVASIIYDTIMLTIPLQHIHPKGECNSQVSEILQEHSVHIDEDEADAEDSITD